MPLSFWSHVLDTLNRGEEVFLAIVVANSDHSPGTRGARLCLRRNGEHFGTIGGGIMEKDVIDEGLAALEAASFAPRLETLHHRRNAPGKASGLICAGEQTNLYQVLGPDHAPLVERIVAVLAADQPGLLTYRPSGLELTEEELPDLKAPPISVGMIGEEWQVREQLLNWKRVAIIGGGHCGLALSRVMNQLGYLVTIFETRHQVFTFQANTHAHHRIVVEDFIEAGKKISAPQWTHVVVMTKDLASDVRGLLGVLGIPFPYIGVMGAPAKLQRIAGDLRSAGFDDDAINTLHAPIGLPMTSNTPEEIAISIAAQILQKRRLLFSASP